MVDETTPAEAIPADHIAYAALHRETQALIKKLQDDLAAHITDESNAFHDVVGIQSRLDDGHARMCLIETLIATNHTTATADRERLEGKLDDNSSATEELLKIIRSGKGFFTVAGWIATGLKWLAGLVLGGIALYTALKGLSK